LSWLGGGKAFGVASSGIGVALSPYAFLFMFYAAVFTAFFLLGAFGYFAYRAVRPLFG